MVDRQDAEMARDGIADTLASIDRGDLEATAEQRAFLAGSVAALDAVTEKGKKSGD
jgi:hypothetical protein